MRPYPGALVVISIALPISTLSAQGRTSALDGAWRHVRTEIVSPEGTSQGPHLGGQVVMSGRHYSQTWIVPGGKATGKLATAEQKADRYEALVANSGTLELRDTLLTFKVGVAKDPQVENTSVSSGYRLRGDTLWLRMNGPWEKDTTKTVRTTFVFSRMR